MPQEIQILPLNLYRTLTKLFSAQLKNSYEVQQAEYIPDKIHLINSADANKQPALAWKIAKEISGRKSTNKSTLKGNSQAERQYHFKNLLGKYT